MKTTSYAKHRLNISVGYEINKTIELIAGIRNMSKAELVRALVTEYAERNKETIAQYLESKAKTEEALAKLE